MFAEWYGLNTLGLSSYWKDHKSLVTCWPLDLRIIYHYYQLWEVDLLFEYVNKEISGGKKQILMIYNFPLESHHISLEKYSSFVIDSEYVSTQGTNHLLLEIYLSFLYLYMIQINQAEWTLLLFISLLMSLVLVPSPATHYSFSQLLFFWQGMQIDLAFFALLQNQNWRW